MPPQATPTDYSLKASHARLQAALHDSIAFRLLVGLAVFLVVFCALSYVSMRLGGKQVLADEAQRLNRETGLKIVRRLQAEIEATETLVKSLAKLGATLPREETIIRKVLPEILDLDGKNTLVAGGGIWPEPGEFTPGVDRRSFFWGRDRQGVLQYFDDYNAPTGSGYHHEEWYVPVRHLRPGQVYWSRSYTDPYSIEPMVTCSAPIFRDGRFVGVATIDLMLRGITAFMEAQAAETGGYAFVVDSHDALISFPRGELAMTSSSDSAGKEVKQPRDIASLAGEYADFAPLLTGAEEMNRLRSAALVNDARLTELAQQLDAASYQIDAASARRIATNLLLGERGAQELPLRSVLAGDVVGGEDCNVILFDVPSTHWKVVAGLPVRYTDAIVRSISFRVAGWLLLLSLVASAGLWLFLRKSFFRPLNALTRQLRAFAGGSDLEARLDVRGRDEFARLSHWFNVRTDMLNKARAELQEKNAALQEAHRVADAANHSKNVFLASMSHEIRTPLNAIVGMSSILSHARLENEHSECVRTILSSSRALLDLVNDIMDFSKIEAGRLDLENVPFDVSDVLEEVSDVLGYDADEKNLRFVCALEPPVETIVSGDRGRLRQILTNLGANAIKFTRTGDVEILGHVKASDRPDEVVLQFAVRDTGIGIPTEARGRLFQPYSQLDGSSTRKHGGAGLGLAICKRLCVAMGGDIDFTSLPGGGTIFTFHVRFRRATHADAPAHSRTPFPGPRTALVLETWDVHRRLLAARLIAWGFTVFEARTEDEACDLVEAHKDLALVIVGLDLNPNRALAARLRDAAPDRSLTLIFDHPRNSRVDLGQAKNAGYDALCQKPFRPGQLCRALERIGQTTHTSARSPSQSTPPRPHVVLLAEDNKVNQLVAAKMLRLLGYTCDVAEHGAHALACLQNREYDLVLMDWHMPVMDGLEAAQRIRALGGRYTRLPIIALTASALQNDREHCLAAGMNDYMSKPLTEIKLRQMLEKWLSSPAAEYSETH
jgi:signal transduction histidine kinase/CheY-like chemotaxis protein